MSAEFDDLVARVKSLALAELREKQGEGATYPAPHQISEAEAGLLLRLWETIMIVPRLSDSPDAADAFAHTFALPNGGAYRSALRPGEVVFMGIDLGRAEPQVPATSRDPIHDAIDAHNKPGRANE